MWYVNRLFGQPQVESLSPKGFLVRSSGGVVRIEKYGCGAELRKEAQGGFHMTIIPSIMAQGQFTRLWDAGYQKFLLTNGYQVPLFTPGWFWLAASKSNVTGFKQGYTVMPIFNDVKLP